MCTLRFQFRTQDFIPQDIPVTSVTDTTSDTCDRVDVSDLSQSCLSELTCL